MLCPDLRPTIVSQGRIIRKIVIVDKTKIEVISLTLNFVHISVLPAAISKLHNQAIRQEVLARKP